jgi:hypothetical protein
VDLHHLTSRAVGGRHELENLVCLCGAHHRAVHERTLVIEGRPATGLLFLQADGRRYGDVAAAREVHPAGDVSGALKGLGFRDGEIRLALARCRDTLGVDATRDEVLRCSLDLLSRRAVHEVPAGPRMVESSRHLATAIGAESAASLGCEIA